MRLSNLELEGEKNPHAVEFLYTLVCMTMTLQKITNIALLRRLLDHVCSPEESCSAVTITLLPLSSDFGNLNFFSLRILKISMVYYLWEVLAVPIL